jgi:hypothetical protein
MNIDAESDRYSLARSLKNLRLPFNRNANALSWI